MLGRRMNSWTSQTQVAANELTQGFQTAHSWVWLLPLSSGNSESQQVVELNCQSLPEESTVSCKYLERDKLPPPLAVR
jgi:hypothetical protein